MASGGVRIGRVGGAPVVVSWSWVVVTALIAFSFADGFGGEPSIRIAAAGAAVVGMFIAVLVHELAHGLAARKVGIGVRQYEFTFFGGATHFHQAASTPGRAALVAAAGPVANLVLGGALWFAYQAVTGPSTTIGTAPGWGLVFLRLALVIGALLNLGIGVFNLIPGLPLDGGALLSALVWKLSGSRGRGATVAGWSGIVLGAALVVWGLLPRRDGLTTTVWTILIGVTVAQGAWETIRGQRVIARAEQATVGRWAEPAVGAPSDTPLADVAPDLARGTWVVVLDGGMPVGYVDPDAVAAVPAGAAAHTPVEAVMVTLPRGVAVPAGLTGTALVRAVAPYANTVRLLPIASDAGHLTGVLPLAPVMASL
jgi:Zn-dependent protease